MPEALHYQQCPHCGGVVDLDAVRFKPGCDCACPQCGSLVAVSGGGAFNPWEVWPECGVLRSYWATLWAMVARPRDFFGCLSPRVSYGSLVLFGVMTLLFLTLLEAVTQPLVPRDLSAESVDPSWLFVVVPLLLCLAITDYYRVSHYAVAILGVCTLVYLLLSASSEGLFLVFLCFPVLVAANVGLLHVLLYWIGRRTPETKVSLQVLVFPLGWGLVDLFFIPYGGAFSTALQWVFTVMGTRYTYRLSWPRAFATGGLSYATFLGVGLGALYLALRMEDPWVDWYTVLITAFG